MNEYFFNDLVMAAWKLITTFTLAIVLLVIVGIIVKIVEYLIISTLCDELEHPVLTFLIVFFIPYGFFFELWRNTSIMNAKRQIYAQENEARQIIEEMDRAHYVR